MTIQHKDIPDAQLHEPKGIASVGANQVYVSNGAGSGTWKFPAGSRYGELFIDVGATPQTLAASSAFTVLNPTGEWAAGSNSGMTLTPSSGSITCTVAGVYFLSFWVTFNTASIASGARYFFKYGVNGVVSTRQLSVQKNTTGVDRLTCSASGIIAGLAANDVITIHCAGDATSSGTAITVADAGLNIFLIA